MPVIRAQQNRVLSLAANVRSTVLSRDPGAMQDIPARSRINGYQRSSTAMCGGHCLVTIRAGGQVDG